MSGDRRIRCIQCGLGPIGCNIVKLVLERPELELVGAIDVAPTKVGRDVADVVGLDTPTGLTVQPSIHDCPTADIVLHSTASHLSHIAGSLREFIELGLNCVSTAEELAWPWLRAPRIADDLNARAKERGVRLLGAGVNPGFVLDLLPILLTLPCQEVTRVLARRIVDTATRRLQLQQKTGIGMTEQEYRARAERGAIGHVGLKESTALLAAGLGWMPATIEETVVPVIAEAPIHTHHFSVQTGQVLGSKQIARAIVAGTERVRLELVMYAGAREPHDAITIEGRPTLRVRVEKGIPGDEATPACVVNVIRSVLQAPPGLLTAIDIVIPRWQAN
ncbi:MAG: NAD(P)H-dependent amine dehydrogenase family protein [Candidatus Zipacnadales bacterium]